MAPRLPAALATAAAYAAAGSQPPNCGDDVHCLLGALTLDEKLGFFAGDLDAIDHVPGVPRLNIPAINMGDGPNGVANTVGGTATSFPCNMAIGDTWDKEGAADYARAMAKEFKAKGKNQWLGPGVNLNRLTLCGRQDEYISGEDPALGAGLVGPLVQGAMDEHVMAMIKHFANNDQETNRNDWSANPDTNVLMEYHMRPFIAGVKAGAGGVMCGYNRVLEEHACKSKEVMQALRAVSDSFFITSDWGAIYPDAAGDGAAEYINAGVDMEMGAHDDPDCKSPDCPPTEYGPGGYCNKGDYMLPDRMQRLVKDGLVTEARVNQTVLRVLKALRTAKLLDPVVQAEFPEYTQLDLHSKWYGPLAQKDVRTDNSRAAAYETAKKAVVLLQNKGHILPLPHDAAIETYGCGSEVHFRAEVGSAAGTEPHIPKVKCVVEKDGGSLLRKTACPYPEDAFRQVAGDNMQSFKLLDAMFGPKNPEATAIFCIMADSKNAEGSDRTNLDLLHGDRLPFEKFPKKVVWLVTPGPVVIPFTSRVDAILSSSLPGEMGGAAVTDVIYGESSPAGHLSMTMPNSLWETPVRVHQNRDSYAEGNLFGYRWYEAAKVHPVFCFGWGLSYATRMQVKLVGIEGNKEFRFTLTRAPEAERPYAGPVDQVVQLYVQHLAPEPRPFKELIGFAKATGISVGESVEVVVPFDKPKTWDSGKGDKHAFDKGWKLVTSMKFFVSLHGVETAKEFVGATVDANGAFVVSDAEGPLVFDQDDLVKEWASKRSGSALVLA